MQEQTKRVTNLVESGALIEAFKLSLDSQLPIAWATRIVTLILDTGDVSKMGECLTVALHTMPNNVTMSIIEAFPATEGPRVGGPDDQVTKDRLRIASEMTPPKDLKAMNKKLRTMMSRKQYGKAHAYVKEHNLRVSKTYSRPTSGYSIYLKRRELDERQANRAALMA